MPDAALAREKEAAKATAHAKKRTFLGNVAGARDKRRSRVVLLLMCAGGLGGALNAHRTTYWTRRSRRGRGFRAPAAQSVEHTPTPQEVPNQCQHKVLEQLRRDERPPTSTSFTLAFTGEVEQEQEADTHQLASIRHMLKQADYVVGALATTLPTDQGANVLCFSGFDAITLSNKQVAERGGTEMGRSLARIGALGLEGFGAGEDVLAQRRPAWGERRGRAGVCVSACVCMWRVACA